MADALTNPTPAAPSCATPEQWTEADRLATAAVDAVDMSKGYLPGLFPVFYKAILERIIARDLGNAQSNVNGGDRG